MSTIFFSVVIPTYNQSFFLKKAINSVLQQSFKDFEIIVIDNFSKDNTQKVVEGFSTEKIVYKKINNEGVIGKSRNEGIKKSNGKWIAFLDSDDYWYSNKLKTLHNFIKINNFYNVICSNELIVDNILNRNKTWKYGPYKKNFYNKLLIDGNCISTSASVVEKIFLEKNKIRFNERKDFITAEDYDFFLNLAFNNAKFKFIGETLGEHLFHSKSESSNYNRHRSAIEAVVRHHVYFIQNFSNKKEILLKKTKATFLMLDLKYYLKVKKDLFKSLKIIFLLIINYPDKLFLFILRKIFTS